MFLHLCEALSRGEHCQNSLSSRPWRATGQRWFFGMHYPVLPMYFDNFIQASRRFCCIVIRYISFIHSTFIKQLLFISQSCTWQRECQAKYDMVLAFLFQKGWGQGGDGFWKSRGSLMISVEGLEKILKPDILWAVGQERSDYWEPACIQPGCTDLTWFLLLVRIPDLWIKEIMQVRWPQ